MYKEPFSRTPVEVEARCVISKGDSSLRGRQPTFGCEDYSRSLNVKSCRSTVAKVRCWQGFKYLFARSSKNIIDSQAPHQTTIVEADLDGSSPGIRQTPFEGWGTSLCWFANVIGGFPEPLKSQLMDLIFGQELGLGLEICRYNIGGSGWSNKDIHNFRYGADIPRSGAVILCNNSMTGLSLRM